MRLRISFVVLAILLVGAVVVAIAQQPVQPTVPSGIPAPPPPAVLPSQPGVSPLPATQAPAITVPPAAPGTVPISPPPASNQAIPLARFDPLTAFSSHTQSAVRAVLLSANWMTRMNQSHGRFIFGFNPSLRQPLLNENDLYQARAAFAMAQLAKFTGDEKQAAMAAQAILVLLAATKTDPTSANCRIPIQSSVACNRVGFAATLAMSIYSLPGADVKLLAQAEQLCEFLHKQCQANGSVHYTDGIADNPVQVDPAGENEYPGLALQAIMMGNRIYPAQWKVETVRKGMAYYRAALQSNPNPLMAATMAPGCAELYFQLKLPDAATAVFEMNDLICSLQIAGNDPKVPQWAGGIRSISSGQKTDLPSGPETGFYLQSITIGRQIARLTPDLDRNTRYKSASQNVIQYLTELQYAEANTRHFENAFRANMLMGAFHLTPMEGNIRIDATATAVTGLLRYLTLAAETE